MLQFKKSDNDNISIFYSIHIHICHFFYFHLESNRMTCKRRVLFDLSQSQSIAHTYNSKVLNPIYLSLFFDVPFSKEFNFGGIVRCTIQFTSAHSFPRRLPFHFPGGASRAYWRFAILAMYTGWSTTHNKHRGGQSVHFHRNI